MSSRTLKKCWWTGAETSGATTVPCTGSSPVRQPARVHDPGELHLRLDRPVLIQVPVEPVLVVPDGGDRRDHHPARASDLASGGAPIQVLPQEPVVLLVHADRVLQGRDLAARVRERHVEIADLAQAIAPQLEGVRHRPQAVLADVERVLEEHRGARVAVRDHHLAEGRAMHDRAYAAAVLVADRVQDEPLARREPDAQPPLLPAHAEPVDLEARALRLRRSRSGGGPRGAGPTSSAP